MAEQTDIEIIRIDTGDAVANLKDLNAYIKDLKKAMNEAEIGSEDFIKAQNELDSVMVKQKTIMNGAANEFKAAKGSFNDLNNQLRVLKEQWKATGDEIQRAELGKKINAVKEQINEMNHSIGNFQDQVGNYDGKLAPLFKNLEDKIGGVTQTLGAMGFSVNGLVNPIKAVDGAFKLLNANPIIGGLTLLIGLFLKIKDAISSNEELQRRWNVAMSAFQPIINAVKNALDKLAEGVVWVAEKIGKLMSVLSSASAETRELAKAQDELNEKKRAFKSNENAMRAEAKQLKAQGKETQDLNEKLSLYQESRKKLRASNQQAVDLAKEELRILEEQAKLAPNSKEDNDKIAEAKQKLGQAQEKLNQEDMEYIELINSANNGLKNLNKTTNSTTDTTKKLADEVERMEKTIQDSSKTQIQKLEEEKRKWVEIYRQVGKNTKALEEYYDKQISKQKEADAKQKRGEVQTRIQSFSDVQQDIAEITGTDTQGSELANRWLKSLDKVKEAYKNLPDEVKKSLIGSSSSSSSAVNDAYKNYIMSEFFPKKREIDPYKNQWVKNIASSINENSTYDEIRDALKELSKGVSQDFSPEGFLNILPEGTISFSSFFRDDKIKELKKGYIGIFNELEAEMEKENPDQGKISSLNDRLNAQVSMIQNLQQERDIYEEIVNYAIQLNNMANAKTGNEIWTERFFGTKTDKNGFATDGEQLGRTLRNATKVWQDYGDAVSTVLGSIGDAWQKNIERQVQAGRMTEEEAKKQFKMIKAMQYSLSVINAAASLVEIWADPSMGVYQKIATTVAVAAQNAAELITIATTQFGDMSGSASQGAANYNPAVINDTNPMTYTRNYTTAEEREEMNNQNVWVSVKDIDSAQDKRKVKVAESRF